MRHQGAIKWISGPVVKAVNLKGTTMMELVRVGDDGLPGEVIRIDGNEVTIQTYEDTSGLKPGEPVLRQGFPISVELGPGLMGTFYDGIQRPLLALRRLSGSFLSRGEDVPALDREKRYKFDIRVQPGDEVRPGQIIATCNETDSIEHRVLVPPETAGKVTTVVAPGEYAIDEVLAEIETERGRKVELKAFHRWPVKVARPIKKRLTPSDPLITGERVIDTFFPMAKGGTAAIPGGFGTGKTMTQHALAKWCDADVIVYIGCGERGNEMTQVLQDFPSLKDPRTGRTLMERTILIANTSNMPVAARDASIYTGVTIAEYYRDMGYHVAVMADSTSRWAEAMREISGRLEEMPAEGGFPAYLAARLASFYERAGMVETEAGTGSVTLIGAVSPPGGDFSEPVTQNTKRFTRCFWGLDKELANQRHYPAISWIDSYSDYSEPLRPFWEERFGSQWHVHRSKALELLQSEAKLLKIVKLVGEDALPVQSRLVLFTARLLRIAFLQQNAFDSLDCYAVPEKQAAMLEVIIKFHEQAQALVKKGVSLSDISSLPGLSKVWRMKSEVANDKVDTIKDLQDKLHAELDGLEKRRKQ